MTDASTNPATDDAPKKGYLALQAVMMPRDTNVHGTIFGGVLLSYIDQAGAVACRREFRIHKSKANAVVTVAMDTVEFHQPVFVGDVVSFRTEIGRVGNTSIAVSVIVETERDNDLVTLTKANVTYVAVELVDGVPRPISIND